LPAHRQIIFAAIHSDRRPIAVAIDGNLDRQPGLTEFLLHVERDFEEESVTLGPEPGIKFLRGHRPTSCAGLYFTAFGRTFIGLKKRSNPAGPTPRGTLPSFTARTREGRRTTAWGELFSGSSVVGRLRPNARPWCQRTAQAVERNAR